MRLKTHILVMAALATGGLLLAMGVQLRSVYLAITVAQGVVADIEVSSELSQAVDAVQRERALSIAHLSGAQLRNALLEQQTMTDSSAARLRNYGHERALAAPALAHELSLVRAAVLEQTADPSDTIRVYGAVIADMLKRMASVAARTPLADSRQHLQAHVLLAQATENLSQARSALTQSLASPRPPLVLTLSAYQRVGVFDELAQQFLLQSSDLAQDALRAFFQGDEMREFRNVVAQLLGASVLGHSPEVGVTDWYTQSAPVLARLHDIETLSLRAARQAGEGTVADGTRDLWVQLALTLLLWSLLTSLTFNSFVKVLRTTTSMTHSADALLARAGAGRSAASIEEEVDSSFGRLVDMVDRLGEQAETDALTGALNRYGFSEVFQREMARAQRHRRPMSLVMFDIDRFNRVNQDHGHAAGDMLLRDLVGLILRNVRTEDLLCRWGGEEFVLLAPETDAPHALAMANKLCQLVAEHRFAKLPGQAVSAGVAQYLPNDTLDECVQRADLALQRAREQGRNRAALDEPADAPSGVV